MKEEVHKPVLTDHVQIKRKLVSPFIAAMGKTFAPYSWTKQLVPEAIWLALVIDHYGFEVASRACTNLALVVRRIVGRQDERMFVKLSDFSTLTKEQISSAVHELEFSTVQTIRHALAPLSDLVADHPLSFLNDASEPYERNLERFSGVLGEIYDRNSRIAVLSMALAYILGMRQDKIIVAPHLMDGLLRNIDAIPDYPNSAESKDAAGSFRASAPMLFFSMSPEDKKYKQNDEWIKNFWDQVAGFGPCSYLETITDEASYGSEGLEAFVGDFRNSVRADLRARLELHALDLNDIDSYEVIGALLARQATLALDFAGAPSCWTPHSAPILLRAMADVYINLAWILKDPEKRANQYIEDGLGAVKLMIAHQERAIAGSDDPIEIEEMEKMISVWRAWLASQKLDVFIEVNLGSWSGMSTRRMAEEAGCLDFYNYVYQPFSSAVHSNWFQISAFNSVHCENPAHRTHRIAAIAPIEPDPQWLFLAAKYLRKTLAHFDEAQGFEALNHHSFDHFDIWEIQKSDRSEGP